MLARLLNVLKFDPYVDIHSYTDAIKVAMERRSFSLRDIVPDVLSSVVIPADILDTGPEIIVQANIPGAKAEDISIKIINNVLHIKAVLQKSVEFKGAVYLHKERRADVYIRSIALPAGIKLDHIHAEVENGVLTLTISKSFTSATGKIDLVIEDAEK